MSLQKNTCTGREDNYSSSKNCIITLNIPIVIYQVELFIHIDTLKIIAAKSLDFRSSMYYAQYQGEGLEEKVADATRT